MLHPRLKHRSICQQLVNRCPTKVNTATNLRHHLSELHHTHRKLHHHRSGPNSHRMAISSFRPSLRHLTTTILLLHLRLSHARDLLLLGLSCRSYNSSSTTPRTTQQRLRPLSSQDLMSTELRSRSHCSKIISRKVRLPRQHLAHRLSKQAGQPYGKCKPPREHRNHQPHSVKRDIFLKVLLTSHSVLHRHSQLSHLSPPSQPSSKHRRQPRKRNLAGVVRHALEQAVMHPPSLERHLVQATSRQSRKKALHNNVSSTSRQQT